MIAEARRRGVPFDQQLAGRLVGPLAGTRVRPNHLTVLSLAFGALGYLAWQGRELVRRLTAA